MPQKELTDISVKPAPHDSVPADSTGPVYYAPAFPDGLTDTLVLGGHTARQLTDYPVAASVTGKEPEYYQHTPVKTSGTLVLLMVSFLLVAFSYKKRLEILHHYPQQRMVGEAHGKPPRRPHYQRNAGNDGPHSANHHRGRHHSFLRRRTLFPRQSQRKCLAGSSTYRGKRRYLLYPSTAHFPLPRLHLFQHQKHLPMDTGIQRLAVADGPAAHARSRHHAFHA